MRWSWRSVVVAGIAAALAVTAAAAVAAAAQGERPATSRSSCSRLMNDPAALKAMRELRGEHQRELRAWQARYGDDPGSAEAQRALQQLRSDHRSDMRALMERFGIRGAQQGQGGCGGCGFGGSPSASGAIMGGGMMGGASY